MVGQKKPSCAFPTIEASKNENENKNESKTLHREFRAFTPDSN